MCVIIFYGNDPLTSIFPLTFSSFYLPSVARRVPHTMCKGSDSRYSLKALIGINPLYLVMDFTDICIECAVCFYSIHPPNPPIFLLLFSFIPLDSRVQTVSLQFSWHICTTLCAYIKPRIHKFEETWHSSFSIGFISLNMIIASWSHCHTNGMISFFIVAKSKLRTQSSVDMKWRVDMGRVWGGGGWIWAKYNVWNSQRINKNLINFLSKKTELPPLSARMFSIFLPHPSTDRHLGVLPSMIVVNNSLVWENQKSIMRFHRKLKVELSDSWEYTWRTLKSTYRRQSLQHHRNLGTPSLHAAQGVCELVLVGGQEEWTQPSLAVSMFVCLSFLHGLVTPVRFPGPSHAGPGNDIYRRQHLLLFSMS